MKQDYYQSEYRHLIHYLVLISGMFIYLLLMFRFQHMPILQTILAGIGSVFYMLWGIIHHHLEGRLNQLVALEYILFGSFIFLLLLGVLNL